MGRYDTRPTETWDAPVAKNKGFPYEFPFYFDRDNIRTSKEPTEDWDTPIAKTGRYGTNPN